jgi:lysophospholipase L1-like esterase
MRVLGFLLSIVALTGCQLGAGSAPSLPPLPAVPEGEDPGRWTAALEAFEAQSVDLDRPVVFVGSSSIRLWSTLEKDMAPLPVLNRGYGGSRIFDTIYWADRLVTPHDPTVVVAFTGTNDIKGERPRPAAWVADRFDELVVRLRALGCEAPLVYIAISPTPSRAEHLAIVLEANRLIRERCSEEDDLHFVDTASQLLDADGQPDPRWFVEDRLHLSAEGYAAWTARVRPVVQRLDMVERVSDPSRP